MYTCSKNETIAYEVEKINKSKGKMTQMTAGDTNQVMGFQVAEGEREREESKKEDDAFPTRNATKCVELGSKSRRVGLWLCRRTSAARAHGSREAGRSTDATST